MSTPVSIRAAASSALANLLTGPAAVLRVAATGRWAAYLTSDDGQVLAVTVPEAVVPPCALVLADGSRPDDLLPTGTTVTTTGAGLRWTTGSGPRGCVEHRLTVTRWWQPESVLVTGAGRCRAADAAGALERLRDRLVALGAVTHADAARARAVAPGAARAVVAGDPGTAASLLGGVLGLGPGLTPSGDDVATGVVLVLRARAQGAVLSSCPPAAVAPEDVRHLCGLLRQAARARTTTVSAALLDQACDGLASAPVADAVRLLTGAGTPATATEAGVVERLLAVGHHSGADLASGMVAAVDALAPRAGRASPLIGAPRHRPDHTRTTFRRSA